MVRASLTTSRLRTINLVLMVSIRLLPGVILSSVISSDPGVSPFMLVLDAKTMEELARATIPTTVHIDLHGLFIPAADSS